MKCISLSPPYATLIAIGAKKLETRGWSTSFRGSLAIHQTAAPGPRGTTEAALWDRCLSGEIGKALMGAGLGNPGRLPRGKIVCVVDVCGVVPVTSLSARTLIEWPLTDQERAFGDYTPGRYAWLLGNVRALATPIPARGMQGLWDVPPDIEAQIAAQIQRPACPHCHAAYDASHRTSGDGVCCPVCERWFTVWFRPGGVELARAEPPATWPKERRVRA